MLISELVQKKLVRAQLQSRTKDACISEIVGYIREVKTLPDENAVLLGLFEREKNGSTGIGNGIGVPHARIENLTEPILFFGISKEGIEFSALDGKPVNIVMLLLAPVTDIGNSLKILANLARMINDKYFTIQLLNVSSDEELYSILKKGSLDKERAHSLH